MTKLVALDYGGVVGDHHIEESESRLAQLFGVDVPTLCEMLSERSHLGASVRRGDMSVSDFWSAQARSRGMSGIPASVAELSRMWAETYRLNMAFKEGIIALRGRALTAIVTNIDEGRSSYLVDVVHILDFVDYLWPSCGLRHTKSEPEMWSLVSRRAREQGATEMLYVDDRRQHVDSARAAGFDGIFHEGDVQKTLAEIFHWVSVVN